MANEQFVREAIKNIETRSREQDKKIVDRLNASGFSGETKSYSALRAAAQALMSGQASRANEFGYNRSPAASWGSWMEGVPLAHALLLNRGLIIDLIPCRTEQEFVEKYKCSPFQFLDILRAMKENGSEFFVNIRNFI